MDNVSSEVEDFWKTESCKSKLNRFLCTLYKLLSCHCDNPEINQRRLESGVIIVKRLWLVAVLIPLIYGIYDISVNNILPGAFELGYSVLMALNVLLFYRRFPYLMVDIGIGLTLVMFWSLLVTGGGDRAGILYLPILPLIVFFLTSRRKAIFWLATFIIGASVIIAVQLAGYRITPYENPILINFLIVMLTISLIALVGDCIRLYYELKVLKSREALRDSLKQVEELKERYKLIFDSSPLAMLSFDRTGTVTEVNSAFLKLWGVDRESIVYHKLSEVLGEELGAKLNSYTSSTDLKGSTELILELKDDERILRILLSMIYTSKGEPLGGLCIFEDITERVKRECRDKLLREKLARVKRLEELTVTLGGLAHDLKNVLTPAVTLTEDLLTRYTDNAELYSQINSIYSSITRAIEMLEDMLSAARVGNRPKKPQDIKAILECLINSSELRELKRRYPNVEWSVHLPENSVIVNVNKWDIYKAVYNLVKNAFEATALKPAGGKVSLSLSIVENELELLDGFEPIPPGRYALLEVKDTGIGIPEDKIAEVFKPFVSYNKDKDSATGLGLSVVYSVVKASRGYIDVRSKPNKGTVFRIYLNLLNNGKSESEGITFEKYVKGC